MVITHSLFNAFVWIYICFEEYGPMPPTVTEPAAIWIAKGVLECGRHRGCGRFRCPCSWICWARWRVKPSPPRSTLSFLSQSPTTWWRQVRNRRLFPLCFSRAHKIWGSHVRTELQFCPSPSSDPCELTGLIGLGLTRIFPSRLAVRGKRWLFLWLFRGLAFVRGRDRWATLRTPSPTALSWAHLLQCLTAGPVHLAWSPTSASLSLPYSTLDACFPPFIIN